MTYSPTGLPVGNLLFAPRPARCRLTVPQLPAVLGQRPEMSLGGEAPASSGATQQRIDKWPGRGVVLSRGTVLVSSPCSQGGSGDRWPLFVGPVTSHEARECSGADATLVQRTETSPVPGRNRETANLGWIPRPGVEGEPVGGLIVGVGDALIAQDGLVSDMQWQAEQPTMPGDCGRNRWQAHHLPERYGFRLSEAWKRPRIPSGHCETQKTDHRDHHFGRPRPASC